MFSKERNLDYETLKFNERWETNFYTEPPNMGEPKELKGVIDDQNQNPSNQENKVTFIQP